MKYTEYGQEKAQTVMLLHGGGLSWWNYEAAAKQLAEHYHVVLPILDGHSGSGRPFTTIENNAAGLIAFIDKELGGSILALGGLSLGGQIALEMLAQRPDICRFALIESALVRPMPLTRALMGPSIAMSFPLISQKWFAKLQADYLGIPNRLFDAYYRDTCSIQKEDMIAFLRENSGYSLNPSLSRSRARACIVCGSREQGGIRASAKLLQQAIGNSTLQILKGYRHGDLSINHPDHYVRLLEELMDSL